MNPKLHAIRIGLQRGWTEFVLSIKSPQDQGFYVFITLITLIYLFLNRDTKVEGTDLSCRRWRSPASWARWWRSAW